MGKAKSGAGKPSAKLKSNQRVKWLDRRHLRIWTPKEKNLCSNFHYLKLPTVNSSAAKAEIFVQLAPISFDEDGFVTISGWLYRKPLSLYTAM